MWKTSSFYCRTIFRNRHTAYSSMTATNCIAVDVKTKSAVTFMLAKPF